MRLLQRPSVQLLGYLLFIAGASLLAALVLTPWLPYPFPKVLRRAATVVAAVTLVPFIARIQQRSWQRLGLQRSRSMWRDLRQGLNCGALLFGTLLVALWQQQVVTLHWPTLPDWLRLIGFAPAALLIALLEEVFFRGVVLQSLMTDLGVVAAVALSSALYAILHFVKYLSHPLQVLPELIGLFLLGSVLAYAYLRTHLLGLSIGLHAGAAFLAKVDRYFVEFHGREPQWFFGTDRWLTGLLGWSLVVGAGSLIHWMTRRVVTTS